ncbi:MAG TPA: hypothetical protein VFU90_03835, partial [Candidatus Tumulicola sp.]|nr:hypothetical protein [Candidatus Tumulicola sp.]
MPFGIAVSLGAGAPFVPGCALGAPFVMSVVGSPAGIMLGAAVELGAAVDDEDGALVSVPVLEGAGWLVDAGAPELPELEEAGAGALVCTSPPDPVVVGAEPHATRACIVATAETMYINVDRMAGLLDEPASRSYVVPVAPCAASLPRNRRRRAGERPPLAHARNARVTGRGRV